jgi:hypothetical protein
MEKALKELKLELFRAKDPKIQKDLRYAIHFLQKAITQQKSTMKKEQRKLQEEARERDALMKEQLREIQRKRAIARKSL